MDTIHCPYCECKVSAADVDDEGGICPECGALITAASFNAEDVDDDDLDDDEDSGLDENEDEDFGDDEKPRKRKRKSTD